MRRLIAAAALCAVVFPAAAQTAAPNPLFTRPGWEIGGQVAKYHYEEPGIMNLTGNRAGLLGAYTFTGSDQFYARLDLRASYGALNYQSVESGSQSNIPDWIVEGRAVFGRDFLAGSNLALSPYFGLGYRYLFNDLRGYTNTNAAGYRRYSNYFYAPLGLTTRIGMGGKWVFAPTLEYDFFIQGRQTSKRADSQVAGTIDVTNTQDSGYGYRIYLMFEKDNWAFGAFTHYWNIKDSDIQFGGFRNGVPVGLVEPHNWTRESGIEVRYRF